MYDKSVALELPRNVSSTEGNKYKLQNHSFHYNFRKFSCAARVVTEPLRDMKKVICYNLFKQIVICLNKLQFVQTNCNLFEQIIICLFEQITICLNKL